MRKRINPVGILTAILFAVILGSGLAYATTLPVLPLVGAFVVTSLIPFQVPIGAFAMAIQKEIWEKDIEEALFPVNSFIDKAFNADEYVLAGKTVHIPQSGGAADIVKNRSSFPATVDERIDDDETYDLGEFTSDPVKITNADTVELSYDKRQSVLSEILIKLQTVVAADLLYTWLYLLGAGSILDTSGAAVAATAPSATGNRKAATLADLQKARTLLAQQERWFDGFMHCLVPSSLMPQLFPAGDAVTATYFASVTEEEQRRGIIAKVQGFNIMERSSAAIYASDGTLKAYGAAGAAGDLEGIVCWYEKSVERAKGEVVAFETIGDPTHYADIYSFLVRAGGRRRRTDNKGIVVVRQVATA